MKQRRKAGLTKDGMAERLGLHRNLIGLMERRSRPISERMAFAIAVLCPDAEATGGTRRRTLESWPRAVLQCWRPKGVS